MAGMTGEQVSEKLGWSVAKVSRIETARTAVAPGDLAQLLDAYEVSGSHREWLTGLGHSARQRGWWDAYADVLGPEYATLIALEAQAESVAWYAAQVVPGLLQTEDYAREIFRATLPFSPPGEIERRVRVQIARRRVLAGDNPLRLWVALDEAALRKKVGGAAVMAPQLRYLAAAATWPNVEIQVVPDAAGAHPAVTGEFVVLHLPEPSAPDVAYTENLTSSQYVEDEGEVFRYNLALERLRGLVLGIEDSRLMITAAGDAMEG
jgi:hypothetical protein